MKKIIFLIFLITGFLFCNTVFADENIVLEEIVPNISKDIIEILDNAALKILEEEQRPEELRIDEDIKKEELGVERVGMLPDNHFYFLKNIIRGLETLFIFDPQKKIEKKIKNINERILEINELATEKTVEEGNFNKIIKKVEKDLSYIEKNIEKIKSEKSELEVDEFVDKMIGGAIRQQIVLENIEVNIDENVFKELKEAREYFLENLGKILVKMLEKKLVITERINKVMDDQEGSSFRELKNIEFLEALGERMPEEFRDAIKKTQDRRIEIFQETYKSIGEENKEVLDDYLGYMKGNSLRHLEIVNKIKQVPGTSEDLTIKLEASKNKIIEKIERDFSKFKIEENRDFYISHLITGEIEDAIVLEEIKFRMRVKDDDSFILPPEIIKTIEKAIEENKEKIEEYPEIVDMFKDNEVTEESNLEENIEDEEYVAPQENELKEIDRIKIEIMNNKRELPVHFKEELEQINSLEEFEEIQEWFKENNSYIESYNDNRTWLRTVFAFIFGY